MGSRGREAQKMEICTICITMYQHVHEQYMLTQILVNPHSFKYCL